MEKKKKNHVMKKKTSVKNKNKPVMKKKTSVKNKTVMKKKTSVKNKNKTDLTKNYLRLTQLLNAISENKEIKLQDFKYLSFDINEVCKSMKGSVNKKGVCDIDIKKMIQNIMQNLNNTLKSVNSKDEQTRKHQEMVIIRVNDALSKSQTPLRKSINNHRIQSMEQFIKPSALYLRGLK